MFFRGKKKDWFSGNKIDASKKEKPLGFSYTRRGVRKSLLVFFISVFYAHFFVYSVQTLPVFCIFVTNVLQTGFPEHRTTGLNCMDFGTLVIYSWLVAIHFIRDKCGISAGVQSGIAVPLQTVRYRTGPDKQAFCCVHCRLSRRCGYIGST